MASNNFRKLFHGEETEEETIYRCETIVSHSENIAYLVSSGFFFPLYYLLWMISIYRYIPYARDGRPLFSYIFIFYLIFELKSHLKKGLKTIETGVSHRARTVPII